MEFDEIMDELRHQRAEIEDDFEAYKQDYHQREEALERADSLYRNILEENANQLRYALNAFEPDSALLGRVYHEYQENSQQVQRFIGKKRTDLTNEFSSRKRQYRHDLDNNEERLLRFQRSSL